MLHLFIKSEDMLRAIMTVGEKLDGVYHVEQEINGIIWNIVVRDDGIGVMAPKYKPSLMSFMRDHLLYSEAWGV